MKNPGPIFICLMFQMLKYQFRMRKSNASHRRRELELAPLACQRRKVALNLALNCCDARNFKHHNQSYVSNQGKNLRNKVRLYQNMSHSSVLCTLLADSSSCSLGGLSGSYQFIILKSFTPICWLLPMANKTQPLQ